MEEDDAVIVVDDDEDVAPRAPAAVNRTTSAAAGGGWKPASKPSRLDDSISEFPSSLDDVAHAAALSRQSSTASSVGGVKRKRTTMNAAEKDAAKVRLSIRRCRRSSDRGGGHDASQCPRPLQMHAGGAAGGVCGPQGGEGVREGIREGARRHRAHRARGLRGRGQQTRTTPSRVVDGPVD